SLAVALVQALACMGGAPLEARVLAESACDIEINRLGWPIGKQDQYIAVFGGIRHLAFHADDRVTPRLVRMAPRHRERLERSLLLFNTGRTRHSRDILRHQVGRMGDTGMLHRSLRDRVAAVAADLERGAVAEVGRHLHWSWMIKRRLAADISNSKLDEIYQRALENGAAGGKISGAGGGGYFLLYADPDTQPGLRHALSDLDELDFNFSDAGVQVVYPFAGQDSGSTVKIVRDCSGGYNRVMISAAVRPESGNGR
ncbi:hypothetical protein JW905_15275, partial [bacterium]|nr:hypothetical protein [candidate division CSSED10-310 bacterium]